MSESSQNFTSNQFNNNIPIKGDTCFVEGFNVLPVMIDPNSVNTLVPGDAVVLTTTDGTTILVDKATESEVPFGYVLYNMQNNQFTAGEALEIARYGTAIYVEANGSISRGDTLNYVPDNVNSGVADNPTMQNNDGVHPISGLALDNATDGQIFRMVIISQTDIAPTFTGGSINNTPIGLATPAAGQFTTVTVNGSTISTTLADAIVALTPGATISLDPTTGGLFTLVPGASCTINAASVPTKHQRIVIIVTTSGTNSYTITFGTHFKSTGTLATGSTSGKVFSIAFDCDGTNFNEASRTTAM